MKYKCLMIDHDDTVVDSTASIHYPSFIEYLKIKKPNIVNNYSLNSYFEKNSNPGVVSLFLDEVGLTDEEFLDEQRFWENYVASHIPKAYPNVGKLLSDFRQEGGIIAVASHSIGEYIKRDYLENSLPMPDEIYSWSLPEDKRKPSPFAIDDICRRYGISPREILVVDDSAPGLEMARRGGADFAAALWAHSIESIHTEMRKFADAVFTEVLDLYRYIFGKDIKS